MISKTRSRFVDERDGAQELWVYRDGYHYPHVTFSKPKCSAVRYVLPISEPHRQFRTCVELWFKNWRDAVESDSAREELENLLSAFGREPGEPR